MAFSHRYGIQMAMVRKISRELDFLGHPPVHEGKLIIEDRNHPATKCFGTDTLKWKDEFYTFDPNPRNTYACHKKIAHIDKKKYLVPADLTVGQFLIIIRYS